jgi:uncharacterized coiled-coil protein SlyX
MILLFTLLQAESTSIPIIYIVTVIVGFIISVFIMRWIFQIETLVKHQETIIRTLEETVIQNEKMCAINLAQLELIASIANEVDVNVADINEVTSKFDIMFTE